MTHRLDESGPFVPQDGRVVRPPRTALHDEEVCVTDAAGDDPHAHVTGSGRIDQERLHPGRLAGATDDEPDGLDRSVHGRRMPRADMGVYISIHG